MNDANDPCCFLAIDIRRRGTLVENEKLRKVVNETAIPRQQHEK